MQYQYLTDSRSREIYKKNIGKIVKEAHKRKVKAVVIAGASGSPVGTFFRHVWKILYPKERLPRFYGLELTDKILGIEYSQDMRPPTTEELEKIKRQLALNYPNLIRDIKENKSVLLLDEYAVSGRTLKQRKNLLSKLGAKEIYATALVIHPSSKVDKEIDISVPRRIEDEPSWSGVYDRATRKVVARDLKKLAEEISKK